jgi:transcriptional regulator with XRE-family HTH domain
MLVSVVDVVTAGAVPDQLNHTAEAAIRRRELAAFVRSRRERISPEQIGLPSGGRRRTPGLRREEVAQLAGVGVTWYTWLEQGRDINPSEQVLESIARTLLVDRHEQEHLFALAGLTARGHLRDVATPLPPSVQVVLDQLDPLPAGVLNARYDILAYNRVFGRLIEDLDAMPPDDRNLVWLAFTNPSWRSALVEWDDAARRIVAQLRAAMADHVGEPAWKSLVARLTDASPDFAAMWARHEVRGPENKTKALINRHVGLLRLDYTNLWFGPGLGTRLVTYTPVDEASKERLEKLALLAATT